jgi:short-subunit dehydrogenase
VNTLGPSRNSPPALARSTLTVSTEARFAWSNLQRCVSFCLDVAKARARSGTTAVSRDRTFGPQLRGKVAVVTGASSGVGRAIVRAFAEQGVKVAMIARNVDGLKVAAEEVRERGSEALSLPLDVAQAEVVDDAAERIIAEWGAIDVWVNNAMVSVFAPVTATTPDEYRRVIEVNYLGYVHGTLAALRHMRVRDTGVILQIGSAVAYRSIPLQSAYCASKAAIRGFTDSLRSELIREGSRIALTMLQLPAVNTPQSEVVRNRLSDHPQPVPPIYQPEVIARAAVHAAVHPKREVWIGWSTVTAIIGQRLVPGLLDRYLSRRAWESQTTRQLPAGHPPRHFEDNVDTTLPGDRGAHGPFDARARSWSVSLWMRMHPRVVASLVLILAFALLALIAASTGADVAQDSGNERGAMGSDDQQEADLQSLFKDVALRPGMMASLSRNLATIGCGLPYAIAAKFRGGGDRLKQDRSLG